MSIAQREGETVGHYAGEMHLESDEITLLLKKYWKVRKKLERLPSAKFVVGKLYEVFELLSEKNTPRSNLKNSSCHRVNELINKMEALFPRE